jgi:lipopolysaccharide export system permease protein
MFKYWKKLDSFILKKFLSTFFFAIMILAVIACVIDYSQKVDDLVKNHAPTGDILFYFLNFIPHIVALLFPLFLFIATIFFTSKMAYKTEIIAMLAAGVSFRRFLRPYVVGSIILGIISLVANHWIVPMANKNINEFQTLYIWNKKIASASNLHLRLSPKLYVYLQSYNYSENSGRLFTSEKVDGTLLREKIMAERASYDSIKKEWLLKNVTIRENDGLKETLLIKPSLIKKYPFTPKDLDDDEDIRETMTTPQLIQYTKREKSRGRENVNFYQIERFKRTAQPFAGFVLTIIGVCIASRKIRGGSGFHLAIGIVISSLYMLFLQFTQTFSTNAGLSPLLAVWIPNFLFGAVALWLYRKQVK